jgi:type VI secretion system protein ImpJ
MTSSGQVHWHEGLFLKPQHLQFMQRFFQNQLVSTHRLGWAYPYGVVEAALSGEDLENLRIRFNGLRAIMPSGLEVDVPGMADLHTLDVHEAFEASSKPLTVSLGVPQWNPDGANTVERSSPDAWRTNRLYLVEEMERRDENTGENPYPVLLRRVNARLLLDGDDRTDLEVLPLLRIVHAGGEDLGSPELDRAFAPPCMLLRGSNVLMELVREVAGLVEASRGKAVVEITRGGFNFENLRGRQLEQVFRLQTLNRHDAVLRHALRAPSVTPFDMYLQLRELLGELAALCPERDRTNHLTDVPDYDHDKPALCFKELCNRIRPLLPPGDEGIKTEKVPFTYVEAELLFAATLTSEQIDKPNEYFLAVKTRQEARAVADLVEDQVRFKFMPRSLAKSAVFGVKLEREMVPPPGFPIEVGLHYFRLIRRTSASIWDRIKREKAVAVVFPGMETTDYGMTLYMTVPEEGKKT